LRGERLKFVRACQELDRENADRLDAIHHLLPDPARAGDVRDVFSQVAAAAALVIPHDEAQLKLVTADGARFWRVSSPSGNSAVVPTLIHPFQDEFVNEDPSAPRLLDDLSSYSRGMRCGVRAPIWNGDQFLGIIGFLSRTAGTYFDGDLSVVQRLADYVAIALTHHRFSEEARRAATDRARAAALAASEDLLRALSHSLDIRDVFVRVSEIVAQVLPHDRMTMLLYDDATGEVLRHAVSNDRGPAIMRIRPDPSGDLRDGSFRIITNLKQEPSIVTDPPGIREQWIAAGYQSVLVLRLATRGPSFGLQFWSLKPDAFSVDDVPVARRIGDHIALAVSHERLAELAEQAAQACAEAERLERRVKSLSDTLDSKTGYGRVVGQSEAWQAILKQATQVAATDTTVLLTGESGTGKEVVARFIHRASARCGGPFVALNCAALPEQLLESELFGHERGAFTGAHQTRQGQIEAAAGGVLFLDEVAEMSPSAQAKFLRVLQEREFQRLGGSRVLKANVRIIAATNRDLRKAMARADFREDLYYRLNVFNILVPPLREHRDDILALSQAFLDEIGRSFGRPPAGLTRDAKEALLACDWPGNVRELRNALERAAIVCEGSLITAAHLSLPRDTRAPAALVPTTDLTTIERELIGRVMQECGGNKSHAAHRLGLTRAQLYVRLRRFGIE
jgi:transcriptional regulator with GAF, ATPase, and Fis domain